MKANQTVCIGGYTTNHRKFPPFFANIESVRCAKSCLANSAKYSPHVTALVYLPTLIFYQVCSSEHMYAFTHAQRHTLKGSLNYGNHVP